LTGRSFPSLASRVSYRRGRAFSPQSAAFADEALLEEMAGYNVSAGLALLDQAGYRPDGNGVLRNSYGQLLTVSILVNADNSHKTAAAQAIAEMLTSAGVTASVSALSFDAYKQAAENGEFDLMLAETTLSPHFDYAMLLSENGALNFGKYASASVSNFISDFARTLFTDAEYPGAALAAHVAENAPILPLGYKKMVFLVRKSNELVGIKPTVSDPFDNILNWSHR
jgi:ABC-type transport system substrate-binding protein